MRYSSEPCKNYFLVRGKTAFLRSLNNRDIVLLMQSLLQVIVESLQVFRANGIPFLLVSHSTTAASF